MMPRTLLTICLALLGALAAPLRADDPPPRMAADLAAEAGDGTWKIRKRQFYVHLARYNAAHPVARAALEDYLKQRIITREAAKRNVTVTEAEVKAKIVSVDRRIRKETGGKWDLAKFSAEREVTMPEFTRRTRLLLLRERIARSIFREKDGTWPRDKEVAEDAVNLTIDDLYQRAPKEFDLNKLPKGVLAKIGGIEITEYDYGRQLINVLPNTEVARALNDLILAEEVYRLLGTKGEPNAEDFEAEKRAYIERERNRILRMPGAPKDPQSVTKEMIKQVIAQRGMTPDKIFANPGFRAQARARGHFMRAVTKEELQAFYGKNPGKYGDRLRVRRIHVQARAQPVIIAGKKVRNLRLGLARANALHLRLQGGEDFAKVAKAASDDPDFIRKHGGLVPLWLTSDAPSYEDTWKQADALKLNGISKPFFSPGRGYVIVKLLKRRRALSFEAQKRDIRRDAGEYEYRLWQNKAVTSARRSPSLFE